MTLVTTSRRSTPIIRSIAKDLAFASGFKYLARGKHGIREIASEHTIFIVIEQHKSNILLTLYNEGDPCLLRVIRKYESGIREGELFRGIRTSDRKLGTLLESLCQVTYIDEDIPTLSFDGPQKRCMRLILGPGEIHEA